MKEKTPTRDGLVICIENQQQHLEENK